MNTLKWKICGLKDAENIGHVLGLRPDYIGFIFYGRSPRYVGDLSADFASSITTANKVGVFVNAEEEIIYQAIENYGLNVVQLHGNERPDLCKALRQHGVKVIKAFGISEGFDWSILEQYIGDVDYFLFDTKHIAYGGSGQVFDWSLLKEYPFGIPYFLSGGIALDNLKDLLSKVNDKRLYAIDVNSRFEIRPGLKDVELLRKAGALLEQNITAREINE
ncbi:phosphoribosylanthranilate isomerase [Olivibacter sitiensis]|uniref:phosphoribosylanthranilate isomerase n=1 Tax=Olivibacter sitiensis TaxID=376470 RepID=UPI000404031B|nr:phosphoribosylanthranilate isomerase [Olivibacter sitiensis]